MSKNNRNRRAESRKPITEQPKQITQSPYYESFKLAECVMPNITLQSVQSQTDDFIKYGDDNDYPNYLINRASKSSIHSSILNIKEQLIKSEGLSYSEDDDIADFLDNIREDYDDTANDLLEQISQDLAQLETFAVKVYYNALRNKITELEYIDSSWVRPMVERDKDNNIILDRIKRYQICPDWKNHATNEVVTIDAYNTKAINSDSQLFFYFKPKLGDMFLPHVSYLSILHYIELHYELGKFSLNTVLNGFFTSAIMRVTANMTEDEQYAFKAKVKDSFTGSENASKLMIAISSDVSNIDVTPLTQSDNTALLQALRKMCVEEIASAHRVQPIVAGIINDGSSLGSDGKLYRDSLEVFYNNSIRPLQQPFVKFLKKVLKFNGYKDVKLEITSSALLSNQLDIATKMDMLKAEVWMAEYGYSREDIKPELLEQLDDEAEGGDENDDDLDAGTITGEDNPLL